ncbi:MAG: hypothetical protein JW751_32235 [Polyangiaceae bacterium]|nr:hypothetical protein [Polyangiaceae bacterium]
MTRDSSIPEPIQWTGRPELLETPPFLRATGWVFVVVAGVCTMFAAVVSLALAQSPTRLLGIGAWAATLALAAFQGPKLWLAPVRYLVTTRRIIVQRGPFRRTMARDSISFARITWSTTVPDIGDLELVRAVQTGPLHRRLTIALRGVRQPNRVWAIIRGAEDLAPRGSSQLPIAQRLDIDERVLWAARPRPRVRAFVPHSAREWLRLGMAAGLFATFGLLVAQAVPAIQKLLLAGLPPTSAPFLALVVGESVTAALLLAMGGYFTYDAGLRSARLVRDTRYLITNKHVLISRGREELHLERSRIVHVIDASAGRGLSDVFLVLDGPRAQSLAASGAFGEMDRSDSLRPVFHAVDDAESVSRILRANPSNPDLPHAA